MPTPQTTIFITGPTASGKTSKAVTLARHLGGEIISADSRQVYRDMDLGTGKDISEYGNDVPYHLIDIVPAGYKYNLYQYLRDFETARETVLSHGRVPIVCGGSGLYIESAIKELKLPDVPADPDLRERLSSKSLEELTQILASLKPLHNTTDVDTHSRAIRAIEIAVHSAESQEETVPQDENTGRRSLVIGIDIPREKRRELITQRLRDRLDSGMIDEVRKLLDSGLSPDDLIYYGLEYKYLTLHLIGQLSYQEMFDSLEIAIHQFAKRQMTWFRGMERRGIKVNWLPYDLSDQSFINAVTDLLHSDGN